MMDSAYDGSSLENTLTSLNGALTDLLATLRDEALSLADPASDLLAELLERKRIALQRVDDLEKTRQSVCQSAGVSDDPAEMARVLKKLPGLSAEALNVWDQILENLATCQQQNVTNGAMLQLRHRFSTKALEVLRGSQGAVTYTAGGHMRSGALNDRYFCA